MTLEQTIEQGKKMIEDEGRKPMELLLSKGPAFSDIIFDGSFDFFYGKDCPIASVRDKILQCRVIAAHRRCYAEQDGKMYMLLSSSDVREAYK